jgi:hypothetical protein
MEPHTRRTGASATGDRAPHHGTSARHGTGGEARAPAAPPPRGLLQAFRATQLLPRVVRLRVRSRSPPLSLLTSPSLAWFFTAGEISLFTACEISRGESSWKEANEQGKVSSALGLGLSPFLSNLYVTRDCFAFCRLWPAPFSWILRAHNYCAMHLSMWPSQWYLFHHVLVYDKNWGHLLMISGLLFAFWSPAMMNTLFSSCYILLWWVNGLLLWWLHHELVFVFHAMSMSYLSTVHISSFFYMTDEAMLMSYDDSSLVLNLLLCPWLRQWSWAILILFLSSL